jgi:hypothetical protein
MITQKYIDILLAGNIPLNKPWAILILLVSLELIFIALMITLKKDKKDGWMVYTLYAKMFALFLLLLFIIAGWLLLILIVFILMILEQIIGIVDIIKVFSFIGIIIVWFIANYVLAKVLGSEKEDEPQIEFKRSVPRRKTRSRRIRR